MFGLYVTCAFAYAFSIWIYTFSNWSGHKDRYGNDMWTEKDRWMVTLSTVGVLIWPASVLFCAAYLIANRK